MPLWGAGQGATTEIKEKKPTYLNDAEKREAYATTEGWTQPAQGRSAARIAAGAKREVLVAIRGLSGAQTGTASGLAAATVTSVNWNIDTLDVSDGQTLSVSVNYNEAVTVVTSGGTPTIVVTNAARADHTLAYDAALSTANRATFKLVIAAGGGGVLAAGDVLSVAAQNVAKNSGTIKDAGTNTNSQVAITAAQGTACGTITAVA
jgi:hypothetical protein